MHVDPTPLAPRHSHFSLLSFFNCQRVKYSKIVVEIYAFIWVQSHGNATTAAWTAHSAPRIYSGLTSYIPQTNSTCNFSFVPSHSLSQHLASAAPLIHLLSHLQISEGGSHFRGWQPLQRVAAISEGPALQRPLNFIVCSSTDPVVLGLCPRATGVKEYHRPCVSFHQLPDMKLESSDFRMIFRFDAD